MRKKLGFILFVFSTVASVSSAFANVHAMLDDWMDDRWSGDSPAQLIGAIEAAGLDMADVEKLLLNGRVSYPDSPFPKGMITSDIPIDLEHVDHSSEYLIYVPTSYDKTTQSPLIVIGHGGTVCRDLAFGERAARIGMNPWISFAEQQGFLLAAPLTDRGWGSIGYSAIFSTLSEVQRDFNVDPNRVYITGHSMGGHLAYRSGIYLGDRWAATSPMSGGYDYVDSGLVENLFNIPGFATWGGRIVGTGAEFTFIRDPNRKMQPWMEDNGFLWKHWEEPNGGHEIFSSIIDDVGNLFLASRRNLYPRVVFARTGPLGAPGGLDIPTLEFDTPNFAACWGVSHTWDALRPIPASTFYWLRLGPTVDASKIQRVWAINKGDNVFDITAENAEMLRFYLHPTMVDFTRPIVIKVNGEVVHDAVVTPDLATMLELAREFDDRGRVFYAAIDVAVGTDVTPLEPKQSYLFDMIGDNDGFVGGDARDKPVQSECVQDMLTDLASAPGQNPDVDLDVDGADRAVGISHLLTVPIGAKITSAQITFRVRSNNHLFKNDGIFFDCTSLPSQPATPVIALRHLLGREPSIGETHTLSINLSKVPVLTTPLGGPGDSLPASPLQHIGLLAFIQNGQFDMVFSDDSELDFSQLEATFVLPSAPKGDLTGDNKVDINDLEVLRDSLNTDAYSFEDPRDLDSDGRITVLDMRRLVLVCDNPRCAME